VKNHNIVLHKYQHRSHYGEGRKNRVARTQLIYIFDVHESFGELVD